MKKALWGVLIAAPLAAVIAAFAPGTDGYKTGCACLSARQGFAVMTGIRERQLDDEKLVAEGLLRRFPVGTPADEIEERRLVPDTQCTVQPGVLVCAYFYEENAEQRRGYAVTYELDAGRKVSAVRLARAHKPLRGRS